MKQKDRSDSSTRARGERWAMVYLLHNCRMVKRHLESVALSVVGIGDICNHVAACVCRGKQIFFSV